MKRMEVRSKCQLSESILFHCTKRNYMDMQKPGPWGRSSSIDPGLGAAVECKPRGSPGGGGCWCLELTDALFHNMQELSKRFRSTEKQKSLNVGTLFKKALDEIHGQTLQILGFFKNR